MKKILSEIWNADNKAFTFMLIEISLLLSFLFHIFAGIISTLAGKNAIAGEHGFRALVVISLWRLMQKD